MDKEAIIEFLRDNLQISLETKNFHDYDTKSTELKISISIGDEVITSDYVSIS